MTSTARIDFTWRVQGIPLDANPESVEQLIRVACGITVVGNSDDEDSDEIEVIILTLAPNAQGRSQQATIRFSPKTPPRLVRDREKHGGKQIVYGVPCEGGTSKERSTIRISFDTLFAGQTVLYDPRAANRSYDIDVLAISGLGSHAYGSFVDKDDENMWLAESVPADYPTARVILWGLDTRLQNNTSFAHIGDLAQDPYLIISQLLAAGRPLMLIGHSLGGLLIQEALSRIAEDHDDCKDQATLSSKIGILFFGVPSQGMDISSLKALVQDQPNRALLESLGASNSPLLDGLLRRFHNALRTMPVQLYCFYETALSPTLAQDPATKRYTMSGPPQCLVNRASATAGLLPGSQRSISRMMALHRTHSNLVKFQCHDPEYADKVDYALRLLYDMMCPAAPFYDTATKAKTVHIRSDSRLALTEANTATIAARKATRSTSSNDVGETPDVDDSRAVLPVEHNPHLEEGLYVGVTFVNDGDGTVSVQLRTAQGKWKTYFDLGPGESRIQGTWVGRIWRAIGPGTGDIQKLYTASRSEQTCTIGATQAILLRSGERVNPEGETSTEAVGSRNEDERQAGEPDYASRSSQQDGTHRHAPIWKLSQTGLSSFDNNMRASKPWRVWRRRRTDLSDSDDNIHVPKLSPDGKYLVIFSTEGSLEVREMPEARQHRILRVAESDIGDLAGQVPPNFDSNDFFGFSPNGRYLVSLPGRAFETIMIWNTSTWACTTASVTDAPENEATSLRWSRDSAYFAYRLGFRTFSTLVVIRNAETGGVQCFLKCVEEITCMDFSPNGLVAIGGHLGGVEIWDIKGRGCLAKLSTSQGVVTQVAFSPSGNELVVVKMSLRLARASISFWETSAESLRSGASDTQTLLKASINLSNRLSTTILGFSRDHKRVYTISLPSQECESWDPRTGTRIASGGFDMPSRDSILEAFDPVPKDYIWPTQSSFPWWQLQAQQGAVPWLDNPKLIRAVYQCGVGYTECQIWDLVTGKICGLLEGFEDFAKERKGTRRWWGANDERRASWRLCITGSCVVGVSPRGIIRIWEPPL